MTIAVLFGLIGVGCFINLKGATTVKHEKERDSFVMQGRTPDKLFAPQRLLLRQVTIVLLFGRLIAVGYFVVKLKGVTKVQDIGNSVIALLCRIRNLLAPERLLLRQVTIVILYGRLNGVGYFMPT